MSRHVIKFNLNDEVYFRIKPESLDLFRNNSEIKLSDQDADGNYHATAQLHCLIRALAPHIGPWYDCPVLCNMELANERPQ